MLLGTAVGPGDPRVEERGQAQEDRVHQNTYRVRAHSLRDPDG